MKQEELLDVYGEDGIETGEVLPKSEVHKHGILHKVVHVWLFDGSSSVLLQKRALTKKFEPGKWALLAGHVVTEEESKMAAVREIFEETGLDLIPESILFLGTVRYLDEVSSDFAENEIVDVYVAHVSVDPTELKPNDEVLEHKYFTILELEKQYANENPQFSYRPDSFSLIKEYVYGPGQN